MLKFGWATREISPPRPAMVQGQMHRRIGREALDPLTVTALAIEGGEPQDSVILISCDLAFVGDEVLNAVNALLANRLPGLPANSILLNATHTHTSMVLESGFYEEPGGEVMSPPECLAWVAERAAEAATEAWTSRARGALSADFGHAVVGHNRRACYADGQAQMYGSTNRADFMGIEGYEDHSVDILSVWDDVGLLSGVIIAIPCPSQVDEGLEAFSADFWHDIRVELRERFHPELFILPLCAPAGDQSPHFLLYGREEAAMRQRHGVSERQEIARRVADAVAYAIAGADPQAELPFAHAARQLQLTPRQISCEEREWAAAERLRALEWLKESDSWWPQRLQEVVDTHDGLLTPEPLAMTLHVLRIGEVALATNPFELFLDYGLRIKARSPAAQTVPRATLYWPWLYLPTARAVAGGGYGAMPAVSQVGPEGGQELVEATLEVIQELFK